MTAGAPEAAAEARLMLEAAGAMVAAAGARLIEEAAGSTEATAGARLVEDAAGGMVAAAVGLSEVVKGELSKDSKVLFGDATRGRFITNNT